MPTTELVFNTPGKGLHEITRDIEHACSSLEHDRTDGLCTVFVRHTSCSLVIQENADPSARHDLETWLDRHVPEHDPLYTHTSEGPDDMPSHIRAMLTATSLAIPMVNGQLGLGTWQGIYLFEHRRSPHSRRVLVHVGH